MTEPKRRRRMIEVDDELWAWFQDWAKQHNITGYNGRFTVQATLRALKAIVEENTHAD